MSEKNVCVRFSLAAFENLETELPAACAAAGVLILKNRETLLNPDYNAVAVVFRAPGAPVGVVYGDTAPLRGRRGGVVPDIETENGNGGV
jgi:hypothetical protein